jgi:hypothetical protein
MWGQIFILDFVFSFDTHLVDKFFHFFPADSKVWKAFSQG